MASAKLLKSKEEKSAKDWDWTGVITEVPFCSGKCTCGHTGLRWLFHLKHRYSDRTAIVGSTCIGHFHEVNPEMVDAIHSKQIELDKAAADKKKAAKKIAQQEVIDALMHEINIALWKIDAVVVCGRNANKYSSYYKPGTFYYSDRRVKHALWKAHITPMNAEVRLAARKDGKFINDLHPLCKIKQYKNLGSAIKWCNKQIAFLEEMRLNPWEN